MEPLTCKVVIRTFVHFVFLCIKERERLYYSLNKRQISLFLWVFLHLLLWDLCLFENSTQTTCLSVAKVKFKTLFSVAVPIPSFPLCDRQDHSLAWIVAPTTRRPIQIITCIALTALTEPLFFLAFAQGIGCPDFYTHAYLPL